MQLLLTQTRKSQMKCKRIKVTHRLFSDLFQFKNKSQSWPFQLQSTYRKWNLSCNHCALSRSLFSWWANAISVSKDAMARALAACISSKAGPDGSLSLSIWTVSFPNHQSPNLGETPKALYTSFSFKSMGSKITPGEKPHKFTKIVFVCSRRFIDCLESVIIKICSIITIQRLQTHVKKTTLFFQNSNLEKLFQLPHCLPWLDAS